MVTQTKVPLACPVFRRIYRNFKNYQNNHLQQWIVYITAKRYSGNFWEYTEFGNGKYGTS